MSEQYREELEPYRDRYRMVHPRPGEISQNGPRFYSDHIHLLDEQGWLRVDDRYEALQVEAAIQVGEGVIQRHPDAHRDNAEGPDDYAALTSVSRLQRTQFALHCFQHGQQRTRSTGFWLDVGRGLEQDYSSKYPKLLGFLKKIRFWNLLEVALGRLKFRWNYNNLDPNKVTRHSWLGRQPQLVAHIHWAAEQTPWLWRRIWWAAVIAFFSLKKDNCDSAVLSYYLVKTIGDRACWFERWAIRRWLRLFAEYWPGGMNGVFTRYWGPDHPLSRYWPKELGVQR